MSGYNLMKPADRARYKADHQAELEAVQQGKWPRDLADSLRWVHYPTGQQAEYAGKMCRAGINYIEDLERRIAAGDPELAGYQP